jgi:glycyl-tRNA synthetase
MQNNHQKLIVVLQENQYIIPSYQLYNGVSGLQDYGILGVRLKNNLIKLWREWFVFNDNIEEIETPVIMPYNLLKASGHVDKFDDFIVHDDCNNKDIRADHLAKKWFKNNNMEDLADQVDSFNQETLELVINKYQMLPNNVKVYRKNLMFNLDNNSSEPNYLRPEIAQAMFVNFKEINKFLQRDLPFGIAQIGKSFRKEISPEQFVRLREFNQAEVEFFADPTNMSHPKYNMFKSTIIPILTSSMQTSGINTPISISIEDALANNLIKNNIIAYFLAKIYIFAIKIGLVPDKLRFRQHLPNEMAHYASECWDLETFVNNSWLECVGCANRGSFDLESHAKASNQKLTFRKQLTEPIISKKLKINTKLKIIASKFKNLTPEIIKYIDGLSQEEIMNIKNEEIIKINININEYVIDSSMFTVEEEIIKIMHEDFVPHVIEPSFGIDRLIYSIFEQNFKVREKVRENDESRIVLSLPTLLAPYDVSVFPLLKKEELIKIAIEINDILEEKGIKYFFDNSSTKIGKKYVRSDEIGIKYAITIDCDTLNDHCVTIRERDSMEQVRIGINDVVEYLNKMKK